MLGNLQSKRDWGSAEDYVLAMWLMLRQDDPGDYIIATGRQWSIADLLEVAFGYVNLDWHDHVTTSEEYCRPSDVCSLCGNAAKAAEDFDWRPEKKFADMIHEMVDHDRSLVAR